MRRAAALSLLLLPVLALAATPSSGRRDIRVLGGERRGAATQVRGTGRLSAPAEGVTASAGSSQSRKSIRSIPPAPSLTPADFARMQREADVPFRAGHHFASELVTFGRANKLRPAQIQFADAKRIYAESIRHFNLPGSGELP